MRDTEKLIDGNWIGFEFKYLIDGDTFRLYDNGVLYVDERGNSEFTAISDAYLNNDGIWQIDIFGK